MEAALEPFAPLWWTDGALLYGQIKVMMGNFTALQWVLFLFLAQLSVASYMLVTYYSIRAVMWLCSRGSEIVLGTCKSAYTAIGWLVVLPLRVFFGPIPLAIWLIRRARHTTPVELVISTSEYKAGDRNVQVPEMANPTRPLRDSELPPCVASMVDDSGVHLGFCSLVALEKGKPPLVVTALHVLKEAMTQGLGKVHILANGKKHAPFTPNIEFRSEVLDVVGIRAPPAMGSVLGLKIGAPAIAKAHSLVKVFSPPPTTGAAARSCTAAASYPKAFRIQYSASTVSGSSGSPLMDINDKIVGVHTYGSLCNNKVVNGGAVNFWKLCRPGVVAETSSKAQDRAEYLDEDFIAGDYAGSSFDEDVVDMEYGDVEARYLVKGSRYAPAPSKTPFVPRSGEFWADDFEEEKADFPREESKAPTSLPSPGPAIQTVSPKTSPPTEPSTGSGKRRKRNRKVRSKGRDASIASAPTLSGKSPLPSQQPSVSEPPLETGTSRSETLRQSEAAYATKRVVFAPLSRPAKKSS